MTLDLVTLLYTYISRFSVNPHYQQQLYLRPPLIALFNLSHKWPTFAFAGESGYTLAFANRIAHKGTHGETGAFPPSSTAGLCAASEIALSAAFVTPDSATLLYTYISRFSVTHHHQQREKILQSCYHKFYLPTAFHSAFQLLAQTATFAFIGKSGYTLAFQRKIAHKGLHGETRAFRMGVVSLPSDRSARSQTSPGRVSKRQTLPVLGS